MTGIGCRNCNASQLKTYFLVKDGDAVHNICKKCCKITSAKNTWWL